MIPVPMAKTAAHKAKEAAEAKARATADAAAAVTYVLPQAVERKSCLCRSTLCLHFYLGSRSVFLNAHSCEGLLCWLVLYPFADPWSTRLSASNRWSSRSHVFLGFLDFPLCGTTRGNDLTSCCCWHQFACRCSS